MSDAIPVYRDGEVWFSIDPVTGEEIRDEVSPISEAQIIQSLHGAAHRSNDPGVCYFVGGDAGPIKIGMSTNLKVRLAAIQACSPIKLTVLASTGGGANREAAYHYQFRECRLHGEWFERTPELLAEIKHLSGQRESAAAPRFKANLLEAENG